MGGQDACSITISITSRTPALRLGSRQVIDMYGEVFKAILGRLCVCVLPTLPQGVSSYPRVEAEEETGSSAADSLFFVLAAQVRSRSHLRVPRDPRVEGEEETGSSAADSLFFFVLAAQ